MYTNIGWLDVDLEECCQKHRKFKLFSITNLGCTMNTSNCLDWCLSTDTMLILWTHFKVFYGLKSKENPPYQNHTGQTRVCNTLLKQRSINLCVQTASNFPAKGVSIFITSTSLPYIYKFTIVISLKATKHCKE